MSSEIMVLSKVHGHVLQTLEQPLVSA